ncbi:MAG: hypothetical protein O3C10_05330 [Chloroflexi bacterium]|nr:hypothetical protein [Chloroflexota bacterium]
MFDPLRELAYGWNERATVEFAYYAFLSAIVSRISGDRKGLEDASDAANEILESESVTPLVEWLARVALAIVAVERSDPQLAAQQYQRLLPMSGKWLFFGGDRLLGLLAGTLGRTEEAVRHHEDAVKFGRDLGYRVDLAWSYAEYAETLLDRDDPHSTGSVHASSASGISDREKAIELQGEALAITQELGMRPLTERILARREILRA